MVDVKKTNSSFSLGRGIGSGTFGGVTTTISWNFFKSSFGFSGSIGLIFECFAFVQPGILRNVEKSVDFLLQHDHPLSAS